MKVNSHRRRRPGEPQRRSASLFRVRDWRVPTKGELHQLYKNRNAIGGFNQSGDYPAGWYWSSSSGSAHHAQVQRFSDGEQIWDFKDDPASLRCVRG